MAADPAGYDDKELYEYSKKTLGIDLVVCPVERYETLPRRGLSLYAFMNRYWDSLFTAREEYL